MIYILGYYIKKKENHNISDIVIENNNNTRNIVTENNINDIVIENNNNIKDIITENNNDNNDINNITSTIISISKYKIIIILII